MIRTDDGRHDETRLMERLDRIVADTLIAAMIVIGLLFCLGAARAAEVPAGADPFVREAPTWPSSLAANPSDRGTASADPSAIRTNTGPNARRNID